MDKLKNIKLTDIIVENRFRENLGPIQELKEKIKTHGVIQPIAVRDEGSGKYRLLAGGRRYYVCSLLGKEYVPAKIFPKNTSDLDCRIIELSENIDREDMKPEEEAKLVLEIHRLHQKKHGVKRGDMLQQDGWGLKETADLMGKSISQVSRDVILGKAYEEMPELLEGATTKKEAFKLFNLQKDKYEQKIRAKEIRKIQAKKPEDVRKKNIIDSYIVGDFFQKSEELPSKCANLIEIDPPYGQELDIEGGMGNKRFASEASKKSFREDYKDIPPEEYQKFMDKLAKESYRLLKHVGWVICWYAKEPHQELVFNAFINAGFTGNRVGGAWIKSGGGQTNNPDIYMGSSLEHFYYFRKGKAKLHKMGRSNGYNYTSVPPKLKRHGTERPIGMMVDLISTFVPEGSHIIVPFAGSGNTMIAADNFACTSIGFDLVQAFKDRYTIFVNDGKPGEYSSYG